MSDPLVQQQETGTMTTDRTGTKERTHAAKDGESHASHDTASAPDHSNRELPEGEVLEGKETQTAEAENRNKNGQEKDDKKVSSSRILIVTLHIRDGGVMRRPLDFVLNAYKSHAKKLRRVRLAVFWCLNF